MELWELVARESIRDLVARYSANGDSGRFDPLMTLFADDAVLEVVGHRIYSGHEEIRSLFTGAASTGKSAAGGQAGNNSSGIAATVRRHHLSTLQIDLMDKGRAQGRSYFTVFTETGADHWGRYEDEYRAANDCWRFQTRKVKIEGQVPGGWAEQMLGKLNKT